jgi:hypothetical protein
MRRYLIIPALAFSLCPACPRPVLARDAWPGGFLARVEALALIETLNADLLASRSATRALEKWCADHDMAREPRVVAARVAGIEKPASAETRQRLAVGAEEPLRYRRVRLSCGGHVLSEADNWYVPSRLSAEANRQLDETDTPFGKAVQELQPFRRTIEVKMMLWSPLPQGWETQAPAVGSGGTLAIPREIFEHRAVLYSKELKPFSEVDETYTRETLDFDVKAATEK